MMICYAPQSTIFKMQKVENASNSWGFGKKKKKSKPKQTQNTLQETLINKKYVCYVYNKSNIS